MSKTRDTGFLGNVIKVDNSGNVSLVSGSTTLLSVSSSGAVTITGTISGSTAESAVSSSYALTASYSSNAELLDGMDSTMFAYTSSFNTVSSSLDAGLKNVIARTGSFATTGSNVFYGNQTVSASVFVSGSVTATGQIVAQTINVQSVTSSVVYSSGSNVFGNDVSNTQVFTGSMLVTGSVRTVGVACFSSTVCSNRVSTTDGSNISTLENNYLRSTAGNFYFDACTVGGNFNFRTSNASALDSTALFICGVNSGVGIGTTTPGYKLEICGANRVLHLRGCAPSTGVTELGIQGPSMASVNDSLNLGVGGSTFVNASNNICCQAYVTAGTNLLGLNLRADSGYVIITTGGVASSNERMRITSGGNVGIGTTTPCSILHVVPTASNSVIFPVIINNQANCPTTGYGVGIRLQNSSISGAQETHKWAGIAAIAGGSAGYSNDTDLAFYVGCFIAASNCTCPPVEKMRIQSSTGNVGIGTTSPCAKLHIQASTAAQDLLYFCDGSSTNTKFIYNIVSGVDDAFILRRNHTTQGNLCIMSWTYNGNVGIGTSTPNTSLEVKNNSTADGTIVFRLQSMATNGYSGAHIYGSDNNLKGHFGWSNGTTNPLADKMYFGTIAAKDVVFTTNDVERMRITSGGAIGIGATSPSNYLYICKNTSDVGIYVESTCKSSNPAYLRLIGINSNNARTQFQIVHRGNHSDSLYTDRIDFSVNNGTSWCERVIRLDFSGNVAICQGNLSVAGSLSKGSGSFRIKHPLLSKKCTHQLVHSFIEGPNADLIYSGRTTLTSGISCINIDCAARMTQGTFEALNRCVRVFTTNESSWDQVKGKVIGNMLVIESQNSKSNDNISWMVIGERQDEHMFETEWTDEEGRVITEPEVKE